MKNSTKLLFPITILCLVSAACEPPRNAIPGPSSTGGTATNASGAYGTGTPYNRPSNVAVIANSTTNNIKNARLATNVDSGKTGSDPQSLPKSPAKKIVVTDGPPPLPPPPLLMPTPKQN